MSVPPDPVAIVTSSRVAQLPPGALVRNRRAALASVHPRRSGDLYPAVAELGVRQHGRRGHPTVLDDLEPGRAERSAGFDPGPHGPPAGPQARDSLLRRRGVVGRRPVGQPTVPGVADRVDMGRAGGAARSASRSVRPRTRGCGRGIGAPAGVSRPRYRRLSRPRRPRRRHPDCLQEVSPVEAAAVRCVHASSLTYVPLRVRRLVDRRIPCSLCARYHGRRQADQSTLASGTGAVRRPGPAVPRSRSRRPGRAPGRPR